MLNWPLEKKEPNVLTYLNEGKIDLVSNIPKGTDLKEIKSDYMIRRKSIDLNINQINNVQVADRFVKALSRYKEDELAIKSWDEYN